MKPSPASAFYDVLNKHESFKVLMTEWRRHATLETKVQEFFEALGQKKVKLGCVKKGTVYLVSENNSVATQSRYHLPSLLSHLRRFPECAGVAGIQLRVDAEAFAEGQLLRVHRKTPLGIENLQELIRAYAADAKSIEQKKACETWLRNLKGAND